MFFPKQNKEIDRFADLLISGTVAVCHERELNFTKTPVKERKQIIEYEGRLRADGMEKFNNEPTYVSAINFYASALDMEKRRTLGVIITYVEQNYIATMMRLLKYPPIDDESDRAMLDSCGTLCNIVSGRFKSEIAKAGYIELEMSHFITYRNSAVVGIEFCPTEFFMYRTDFEIDGKKRLVIEMSMGHVPRRV